MGAGHGQHMAALQDVFSEPLRAAGVGRTGVQNGLNQRELGRSSLCAAAAHGIANHKHIGLERQLVRAIALNQVNSQSAQLVAHGRVNPGVATCHAVARLARQRRQTAHESAANAQNVNMHGMSLPTHPAADTEPTLRRHEDD